MARLNGGRETSRVGTANKRADRAMPCLQVPGTGKTGEPHRAFPSTLYLAAPPTSRSRCDPCVRRFLATFVSIQCLFTRFDNTLHTLAFVSSARDIRLNSPRLNSPCRACSAAFTPLDPESRSSSIASVHYRRCLSAHGRPHWYPIDIPRPIRLFRHSGLCSAQPTSAPFTCIVSGPASTRTIALFISDIVMFLL
jgi:hypothetical protein